MLFPTLNKRPHHHKPYSPTWGQVSVLWQKFLQKMNSNTKAKIQCLKVQKESYHSTSQKEAPTTTESKYSSSQQAPSG